jgi:DNA primase
MIRKTYHTLNRKINGRDIHIFYLTVFLKGGGLLELTPHDIEAIKKAHDLVDIVASYDIKVHKKGANYAPCDSSTKKRPLLSSSTPKPCLYHCFGCNAAGDVIGFVSQMEGVGFREAMKRREKR